MWKTAAAADAGRGGARAGLVALAGVFAGALAEVLSGPLDDNLTVPVASALTITALLAV